MAESNVLDMTQAAEDPAKLAVDLQQGIVKEATHPEGIEMSEWCFTNDKENPAIRQLFHMLYQSAFVNKLGLMHALNKDTNEVQTLIVGVEVLPSGEFATWPIAKILTEEEQNKYRAPDGKGNYVD